MIEIIVALIAVIGVFVGINVTKKTEFKKDYSNLVSNSRNDWSKILRDEISICLANAKMKINNSKCCNYEKDYYISKNKVIIRLNSREDYHILLINELNKLDNCTEENYEYLYKRILFISDQLLKKEWEKVKNEARGYIK